MSQKNYNYTCEKILYYIFFVIICLQETQIWKHRVIEIEKLYKVTNDIFIYIHTITKLGIHVEKKLKERNVMGKMKNELMIQKNMLRVEMAFNDSADNNGKKNSNNENDDNRLSVRWR